MKKRLAGMLLIILLAIGAAIVPASAAGNATVSDLQAREGFQLVSENNKLALYVAERTGQIALYSKTDGTVWESNPVYDEDDETFSVGQKRLMSAQFEILYYDSASTEQERNSQIACVGKNSLSCKISGKTAVFTYDFRDEGISFNVEYKLGDDYLDVNIPTDKISEGEGNRLTEISVLPFFGCGELSDNGYMFIPDGSGSIIEMNNGKSAGSAIKERVYGSDSVICPDRSAGIEQKMTFPVIGINKNGKGLMSVVTEGDASSYVNTYTAGMKKLLNCNYFSFEYRATDSVVLDSSSKNAKTVKLISEEPISSKSWSMRYYPLANGTYAAMANRYREYLISDKGLTKSENADKLSFFVNSYGAIRKQGTIFFIPATVTVPLTTYKQAGEIMNTLTDAGIENIVFNYNGWTKGGVTGEMPVAGKYESKLGGKKQFEALLETAGKLGVTLMPSVNVNTLYDTGRGYSKNNSAAATLDGTPGLQYIYNLFSRLKDKTLKPFYLVSPSRYDSVLTRYQKSYKLDTGISFGTLGNMLYSDHHKENCDRLQTINFTCALLEKAAKSGTVMTSSANAYAAVYSDYIAEAPTDDTGFDIEDRSVPFYQIVLSGFKSCSVEAVNLSAGSDASLLKAIETGSSLCYTFTAQNFSETGNTYISNIYNSDYRDWTDTAAKQYETLKPVFDKISGCTISEHNALESGVFETVYSNGVRVRVNYSDNDFTDTAGTVAAGGFTVIGQGAAE